MATLVPTKKGSNSVARTTSFLLTSLDGTSASAMAAKLVVDPPVAFSVKPSGSSAVVVTPNAPLAPSTLYHLALRRDDGTYAAVWTARTAGPLQVTDTVPGSQATGVPLNTGIEFTFNQAGVTAKDMAAHVTISPKTAGHFEVSGRMVAFVPDRPLKKATLYTVMVRHGLAVAGTNEALAQDKVLQFETASSGGSRSRVWLRDSLVDATPREHAAITVWTDTAEGEKTPARVPVTVHRLPGIDAAVAAWTAIAKTPEWTMVSAKPAVVTRGLTRVVSSTLRINKLADGTNWIQLPRALPAGWYVLTVSYAGIPRQLILQITDTATYALVTATKSTVWVNNIATGAAARGATVTVGGDALPGATDARGLLVATTPRSVASGRVAQALLLVRYGGSVTFRPLDPGGYCAYCGGKGGDGGINLDPWWSLLQTDRGQYRPADTMNVVGVAKHRGTNTVPPSVRLQLFNSDSDSSIATLTKAVTPDARGMYTASIALKDVPAGGYRLRATVDGEQISEAWINIGVIRKPAYAISVTTARHAVITGQPLRATATASFFEGTPVAGAKVSLVTTSDTGEEVVSGVTTNIKGQATGVVRPEVYRDSQTRLAEVVARAALPEEGSISGQTQVMVFAGSGYITLDGAVSGSTLRVTGALNQVAFERYEAKDAVLDAVDPRGAPIAGATVRVSVTLEYAVATRVGTAYSFITKRTEPTYHYSQRQVSLGTRSAHTGADGSFQLTFPATRANASYSIVATYRDAGGRTISTNAGAWTYPTYVSEGMPELVSIDGHQESRLYEEGDTIRVKFIPPAGPAPVSRYLFGTLQQGLRYVTVGTQPTFRTTFTKASVPNVEIIGVRFSGAGYDVAYSYTASLDLATRALTVKISADKARYEPGETAHVTVRTLDRAGRPVSASVFVRAVDEKLYAMGVASDQDPLWELYEGVPNGVIGRAVSHQVPGPQYGGGGGDTTGGGGDPGGRTDFRDWLIAKHLTTDATGTATLDIPLSDDLTSWRVAATAVDAGLRAAEASAKLPVGLPFFVDAVIAPEYTVADKAVVRVRSFGTALAPTAKVTFTLSSTDLAMAPTTITATAFESAWVALPALTAGTHTLRIAGSTGAGSDAMSDAMVRTFTVVTSRATQMRTTWTHLAGTTSVTAGAGGTRVLVVDAGRGRVVPLLESLAANGAVRSDQELAAALANRVLVEQFGLPAMTTTDPTGLDVYKIDNGLSIVSWASPQLEVSALAAMAGDPRLEASQVQGILSGVAASSDELAVRKLLALAGLAAQGEPVADQVRALAGSKLSVEGQANLALAYLELGDEASAARVAEQVLRDRGLRRGDQVRIDAGPREDSIVVTARLAIVLSSLGDPIAAEMDNYLDAHPSTTTSISLERALAARGWANRVASAPATVTMVVDGERRELRLEAGRGASVVLSAAQAASATVTPVSGSVLVVQSWDGALAASTLALPKGLTISRSVSPTGTLKATDTVVVTINVELPRIDNETWRVVDFAPSGLVPIPYFGSQPGDSIPSFAVSPTSIDGQRVEFSVGWNPSSSAYSLQYLARIVTPGTYAWEPSVIQSTLDPTSGATVAPTTLTIATPGG